MSYQESKTQAIRQVSATADGDPPSGDEGFAEVTEGRAVEVLHKPAFFLYTTASGTTPTATIVPYWWDEATQTWAADPDQSISITAAGAQVNRIEARGKYCQPRVTVIGGTDPVIAMRYMFPIFYGF